MEIAFFDLSIDQKYQDFYYSLIIQDEFVHLFIGSSVT